MNKQLKASPVDATLDPDICRRARLSRDSRFDGEFFLAVRTTGIYCRPICPARAPAEQNVSYFRHAAQAAGAGYRPCLRCRPESTPGSPAWEGSSTSVKRALRLISEGALYQDSLAALAARLGVGERYLRKLFQREVGVSPQAVAHNQRLLFARKLLAETSMPLTEIAYAAGFGSLRRFNSAMKEAFRATPGDMRRGTNNDTDGGSITLQLQFRPPYDWPGVLDSFGRHAINGLEVIEDGCYRRRVLMGGSILQFQVGAQPRKNALQLRVELNDQRQLMPLVARVRQMFDLDANPALIEQDLGADPSMKKLLLRFPGVRCPVHWSAWESAVRGIVGQQVSIAAARTVCGRLVEATTAPGEELVFPSAAALGALGDEHFSMPTRRRESLRALCREFKDRESDLDIEGLAALPGVGPWTTALVAMRGFGDPDMFPSGDLGLVKSWRTLCNDPEATLADTENWRPWRSYAANLLWRSLLA